ncbi:MAG: ABC transporter permease [Acidimicrobiales bacterium]
MIIYANELHRRFLDLTLLILAVVAPLLLALILGFAFGQGPVAKEVRIGVAFVQPHPNAELKHVVATGVIAAGNPPSVQVIDVSNPRSLLKLIHSGALLGGVVVPTPTRLVTVRQGNSPNPSRPKVTAHLENVDAVPKDTVATLTQLLRPVVSPGVGVQTNGLNVVVSPNSPDANAVARSIASGISLKIYEGALRLYSLRQPTSNPAVFASRVLTTAASIPSLPIAPTLQVRSIGSGPKSVLDYFSPSVAVIFIFVGASLGTRSILLERERGTLARLVASPISPTQIVVGKLLAILSISFLSILSVWGTTVLLFSANWGSTSGVLLMCIGSVLSMGGIAFLITSFARDEREALAVALIVGLLLALLGGNMLPPGVLPGFLQVASLATPNGWALVGFGRLALEHRSARSVVGPFSVLCLISLVTITIAAKRINSMMKP